MLWTPASGTVSSGVRGEPRLGALLRGPALMEAVCSEDTLAPATGVQPHCPNELSPTGSYLQSVDGTNTYDTSTNPEGLASRWRHPCPPQATSRFPGRGVTALPLLWLDSPSAVTASTVTSFNVSMRLGTYWNQIRLLLFINL